MSHARTRRATLAVVAAAAGIAALAASAASGTSARRGMKSPAGGAAALYRHLGQPLANRHGSVLFTCQVSTPPACYGPDQIRAAYGIQPLLDAGYDGTGRTVAIVDAYGTPTIADDLALFDAVWGLPDAPGFHVDAPFGVDPADPVEAQGWAGETSLDVEWAHAVAPGATIELVIAKSSDDADILQATQWVLDHDAGDVLSQSYGEAEQCMDPALLARQHELFQRLTRRNVTLFASSGDNGAGQPTCDSTTDDVAYFEAASTPASDPYVTGVGGTALDADGTGGAYVSETTWNESTLFGDAVAGGGGLSVVYTRPSYQAPVLKEQMRGVPDVAYDAAVFGGVIVVWGGDFWLFGGTSAGSPQWSGLVAIADEMRHGRVGPINRDLYEVGKNHKAAAFFHDVADGSTNSIPDLGIPGTPIDGFAAAPGYDLATGLGTPIASSLVPYLAEHGGRGDDDHGWGSAARGGGGSHAGHGHKHEH